MNKYTKAAIGLSLMVGCGVSSACDIAVERLTTLTTISAITGVPTSGMVIVDTRDPVFTGAVDNKNKYIVDVLVEFPNGGRTRWINNVETFGKCK